MELYVNNNWTNCYANTYIAEAIAWSENGKYHPDTEIDQIEDEEARKRSHKHTYNVQEEYELLANDIKDLFVGEGFIRYKHKLEKFKAPYIPDSQTTTKELEKLKQWYADKLMIPRSTAVPMVNALFATPQVPEAEQYDGRKRAGSEQLVE